MDAATKVSSRHCKNCSVEIGGYFGNKVYRYHHTDLCVACGAAQDLIVQKCIALTGMTPKEYQNKYGKAWNE